LIEFFLGISLIIIGALSVAFPGKNTYLVRIINLEIPAMGLLLIFLIFNETLALLTFIAVTAISTFVLVRVTERRHL